MRLSVLTVVRERRDHLVNLIRGLTQQTMPVDELVVAVMEEHPLEALPPTDFPIRQVVVAGEPAPLARARNAAADRAQGEFLVFLDVDCIPTPSLAADYCRYLEYLDGLMMGEVLYLPKGACDGRWDFARLARLGVKHSDRSGPPANAHLEICRDYRCFWSLNFALRRQTFKRCGGFDESFVGYGGEDTDFGKHLDVEGVPFFWCRGARAFHQYHPHHMPPVHHLQTVLKNSENFRRKWGYHTMEHWLYAFQLMGLIAGESEGYRLLREPTEADLALTSQRADQPFASSAWTVRYLRQRAAVNDDRAELAAAITSV